MSLVYIPFNKEEMLSGDCLISGEFKVDTPDPSMVRDLTAKHYLDENASYDVFVEEFATTIDGVWEIEESTHANIMNSMPDCGSDSAIYAVIHTLKNMITNMATNTIYFN